MASRFVPRSQGKSHAQKQVPQQSTSIPVQNQLRSRPFAPPIQTETTSQGELPDLQTQLENANRLGHSFSRMVASRISTIQPKLTIGAVDDVADPAQPITNITEQQAAPDLQTQLENAQRFGHSFAKIANGGSATPPNWIQPKLTIGAPGDKYEQEADRVAQQVVQRINVPEARRSPAEQAVQRETVPEEDEELQMSPLADQVRRMDIPDEDEELQMQSDHLQRDTMPDEEEELQMSPDFLQRETIPEEDEELQMSPMLQRQANEGAVPATTELESAIQQSRGSGQPITESIRQPMEHAFGNVDFSGVNVHTDTQSDQLNRSIQAKAFTTGQDIFFRQGAYQPGSRGGQELLAHELTHVVQQDSEAVKRSSQRPKRLQQQILPKASSKRVSSAEETLDKHQFGHGKAISLVIQRDLTYPEEFNNDMELKTISNEIPNYNKLPKTEGAVPQRLSALEQVTRNIYKWYNSQDTYDLKALDNPIAVAVRRFEKEVDQEFVDVVGTASKTSAPIGEKRFSSVEEKKSVDKVWMDLLSGTGYLKIDGSAEFQKQIRTMLFRILNTESGRKLIMQIASGGKNQKTVTIGQGKPPESIKKLLYEPSTTESKAIPQVYASSWSWSAKDLRQQMTNLTEMIQEVNPSDPQNYYEVKEPQDLHAAIMNKSKGIKAGSEGNIVYYKFASGAYGAYVALVEKEDDMDIAGENGKSVHTPEFVTLAHELGHALNQLAGAATLNNEELFKILGGGEEQVGTYENPGPARTKWSNCEELFTILGIENAVRKEVGLASRGSHAAAIDPELIEKLNREKALFPYLIQAVAQLPVEKVAKKIQSEITQSLYEMNNNPVKNLSQTEKKQRCNEYETRIKKIQAEELTEEAWKDVVKTLTEGAKKTLETYLPELVKDL